jgi:hypothetical protein
MKVSAIGRFADRAMRQKPDFHYLPFLRSLCRAHEQERLSATGLAHELPDHGARVLAVEREAAEPM